jgi:hypothetical protein
VLPTRGKETQICHLVIFFVVLLAFSTFLALVIVIGVAKHDIALPYMRKA